MSAGQVAGLVLILALAASLAGNAYLWHERDGIITREARAEQLERDTRASAQACSSSVDDLARAGRERQKDLMAALAQIAPTVSAYQAEAIASLRARPDDPKDLCGSLERYLRNRIKAGAAIQPPGGAR